MRGQGHGSGLLTRFERVGLSQGANRAFLDTMEFQAVGFYLRRGYEEFGRIRSFAKGFDRVFLQKALGVEQLASNGTLAPDTAKYP